MRRRWQDAAFVIPVFAVLVMLPPFLNLFAVRRMVFGLPLEVVYLFTIWAVLVGCGVMLSRRLPHQIEPSADADSPDPVDN